jgi:hypothetical protein
MKIRKNIVPVILCTAMLLSACSGEKKEETASLIEPGITVNVK